MNTSLPGHSSGHAGRYPPAKSAPVTSPAALLTGTLHLPLLLLLQASNHIINSTSSVRTSIKTPSCLSRSGQSLLTVALYAGSTTRWLSGDVGRVGFEPPAVPNFLRQRITHLASFGCFGGLRGLKTLMWWCLRSQCWSRYLPAHPSPSCLQVGRLVIKAIELFNQRDVGAVFRSPNRDS